VKLAAAMSQIGSPMSRSAIAMAAVSRVAAQGQSFADRSPRNRGSTPSSLSCDSVREAPASGWSVPWNMLNIMKPIATALPALPNSGA
jgi:hypothetical protein